MSEYHPPEDAPIYGSDPAECVDDPRKQLEELEAQILRTEKLLAQLVRKRVPLKRKINSRFAPVLQLPLEISSEIFSSCFPSNSWGLWHSKTPLALGEVCSAWRDLAWSMPWLWSTVSLDIRQCSAIHAVLLSEWLGRTAELPLSIHLRLVCDILTPPEVRSAAHLLDVLTLHSERWCHIDFDIPFFFPNGIRSKGPVAFPLLRNMSLHVMGAGSQVEAFRLAPNLRTVCLKGFIPGSVALPLSQITHIRLGPTTADECLNILSGTPNLTHCIFEDILRSDVVNPSPILARRLESFKETRFRTGALYHSYHAHRCLSKDSC
ncbi:hypothetical protein BDZ94DRAFT_132786 [Collybia nuda]|uniref:F-box domain-containing protein n=1 Tax=Collybia nuda TaxID=64659 RepID=A0A9P5YFK6_9AGAR|nr:hypothetical protein BDZ94DRAFT_132786 [Collybia nuda]